MPSKQEETLRFIINEQNSYFGKLSDAEWDCYNRLSGEEKLELERWEEFNKIPKGMFEK